jgi:hypothetical protein
VVRVKKKEPPSGPSNEIAKEQCGREEKQGNVVPKNDAV